MAQNPDLKIGDLKTDWLEGKIVHVKEDGSGLTVQCGNMGDLSIRNEIKFFKFSSAMKFGEDADYKIKGNKPVYLSTFEKNGDISILIAQNLKGKTTLTKIDLNSSYEEIGQSNILQLPNDDINPKELTINWSEDKSTFVLSNHQIYEVVDENWPKEHYVISVKSDLSSASFVKAKYDPKFTVPFVQSSHLIGQEYLVIIGSDQVKKFGMRWVGRNSGAKKRMEELNVQDLAIAIDLKSGKTIILKGKSFQSKIGKAVNFLKVIEDNGIIKLYGTYSNTNMENHKGMFSATYDPNKASLNEIEKSPWGNKIRTNAADEIDSFRICDLFKTKNNKFLMPVEKIYVEPAQTEKGFGTFCYSKTAMYVFILDKDLEIEKVITLDGKQPFNFDFDENHEYAYSNYKEKDLIFFNDYSQKGVGNGNTRFSLHMLMIDSKTSKTKVVELGYKDVKTRLIQAPKSLNTTIGNNGRFTFTGYYYAKSGLGYYKFLSN